MVLIPLYHVYEQCITSVTNVSFNPPPPKKTNLHLNPTNWLVFVPDPNKTATISQHWQSKTHIMCKVSKLVLFWKSKQTFVITANINIV